MDPITARIISFLEFIGIPVYLLAFEGTGFLPGIKIEKGSLTVDLDRLSYPGDLLHEAGHIAVVAPAERATLEEQSIGLRPDQGAEEMMAIAWSYAACLHLGLDPLVVFHEQGYKGGGKEIARGFAEGGTMGVPMLQYCGMTYDVKRAAICGEAPFPHMIGWMRGN